MPKLLTDLELKVMNALWTVRKGFVKDLLGAWPGGEGDPPAYNTVSTVLRILEDKGYVSHEAYGRSHAYFPLVKREKYRRNALGAMIEQVFSGSMSSLVSALADHPGLTETDRAELLRMIERRDGGWRTGSGEKRKSESNDGS